MICISIAQDSRRFALVDMANAARQCDLVELRLDRFQKAPDIGQLIASRPKPIILSCRRPQDGGDWAGSEEDRLALLRQCIISKADYVEIELDVADRIRPFPPAKRVISYTNFQETPADIADIYAQAQSKGADVVKLVTLARTPEEAWPLVKLLAKPALPTVVVGIGKPGVMLTILGKKIGAPWTYAALERGMETYPGQPTVADLERVYHYQAIDRKTPLVGVTGLTEEATALVALLNAAFAHQQAAARCLPLQVGSVELFGKVIHAIRLEGVVVDEPHRAAIQEIAAKLRPDAVEAEAADLIVAKDDRWHGVALLGRAVVAALEDALRPAAGAETPLRDRTVMIVGTNAAARMVARRVAHRGGVPIIAGRDRTASHKLAEAVSGRHVPFEALYGSPHEVLIVCSDEQQPVGTKKDASESSVHPGYLTSSMTVVDLTALPRRTPLLREAEKRRCRVVSPRRVLLDYALLLCRALTGKTVAPEALREVMDTLIEPDD